MGLYLFTQYKFNVSDVEQGLEEQDNLTPLLNRRNALERLRPPHPLPQNGHQDIFETYVLYVLI